MSISSLSNGTPATSHTAHPSSSSAAHALQQQQQIQAEQLQLLQLSFGEHEFGLANVELFPAAFDPSATAPSSSTSAGGPIREGGDGSAGSSSLHGQHLEGGAASAAADAAIADIPFDPFQFVDEKLDHGLDLEALNNDLGIFERFLQGKILQHVHDELHEAFVNVSGRLVGLEEPLQRVRGPLQALTTKLETALHTIGEAESNALAMLQDAQSLDMEHRFYLGLAQVRLLHHACCNEVDAVELFVLAHAPSPTKEGTGQSPLASPLPPLPVNLLKALRPELLSALQEFPRHASPKVQSRLAAMLQQVVAALFDLRGAFEVLVVPTSPKNPPSSDHHGEEPSKAAKLYQETAEFVNEAVGYVSQLLGGAFLSLHAVVVQLEETGGDDYVATKKVFRDLMQLYTILGPVEFASIYRDGIVRPFVENFLSWKACTQARANTTATAELITKLIESVERSLLPACPLIRDTFASSSAESASSSSSGAAGISSSESSTVATTSTTEQSLYPISSIFWPAICSAIATRLVFLFTPGIPQVFHANFVSAHRIVRLMERHCTSVEELRAFRMSTDTTLWIHTWNIDVYHTLRATAGSESVKEILANASLVANASSGSSGEVVPWPSWIDSRIVSAGDSSLSIKVQYPVTKQIMHAMLWYFSPDVFLYPLSAKLLREAVITLQRFVLDMVQRASPTSASASAGGGGSATAPAASSFDPSIARRVLCDIVAIQRFVDVVFRQVVESVTSEVALTCQPLSVVFQIASSALCDAAGIQKVKQMLVVALEEQCYAQLQHLRTVKATYSHTKKALPTQPSWFTSGILDPLHAFQKQCSAEGALSADMTTQLLQKVIDHVALRFKELTKETLISARKTEESLGKLRRKREEAAGKAPSGGAPAAAAAVVVITNENASDRDKMVVQLFLDAQKFSQLLTGFQIAAEDYSPMKSILKLCRRGQWIVSGCVGPEPAEVEEDE